jgi:glutamate racemase
MHQQNFPQGNYQPLPTSTLAVISLISGILGFIALPILASIVALFTGYAARGETRSVPPTASGDGLATAGIVMGWIQIGLAVIGVCCTIAYFVFVVGADCCGGRVVLVLFMPSSPIGIFDSGIGGLSVLRAIRQLMPDESLIYLADQAHVPYGPRPLAEIQAFSVAITRFLLLGNGAKMIVVACNTASAAALHHLRAEFPDVAFVGMEPAVKPAAEQTHSGVVGVLATPATFQGALYASVVERFANGVTVLQDTCPGLVGQIERGDLSGPDTCRILEDALRPMLAAGADTVVMGCTHYPFVIPLIEQIGGGQIRVIDPAPAVARQAKRVLEARGIQAGGNQKAGVRYYTSGAVERFDFLLEKLLGEAGQARAVGWRDGQVYALTSANSA